jgi:hypothetical protein
LGQGHEANTRTGSQGDYVLAGGSLRERAVTRAWRAVAMNTQNRRLRVILSALGLVCVAASLALNFIAPGTWWNWVLLLVALVFLLVSRRYQ